MAKYEVGQEVRIKPIEFLKQHRNEEPTVTDFMFEYANKVVKITDVAQRPSYIRYRIKDWWWDESWLEPAINLEVDTDVFMNLLNI